MIITSLWIPSSKATTITVDCESRVPSSTWLWYDLTWWGEGRTGTQRFRLGNCLGKAKLDQQVKKVFVENSIDEGGLAMSTNLGSLELDLSTIQSDRRLFESPRLSSGVVVHFHPPIFCCKHADLILRCHFINRHAVCGFVVDFWFWDILHFSKVKCSRLWA